ncbi:hypothetical protein [Bacillus dakarensis]|uniref:hypothetical protein n=1 Tax=Robertmurraya dakarensis TaxID=1926278 RepID=UPI0009817510|nr:hypothetical protein [Bacillus dakarensis]
MDKDQLEQLNFLEQQLKWSKEQDHFFAVIEEKLWEMKKIAEYAEANNLSLQECEALNKQLSELKNEIRLLENKLHSGDFH